MHADLSSIIRESLRLYFVLREATHLTELRFEQAPRRSSGIGEVVTISRSALCSGVGLNRSSDACGLPEKRLMTYSVRADCNLQARAAPRQSIGTGVPTFRFEEPRWMTCDSDCASGRGTLMSLIPSSRGVRCCRATRNNERSTIMMPGAKTWRGRVGILSCGGDWPCMARCTRAAARWMGADGSC